MASWPACKGEDEGSARIRETGKRAVVFGWWMRALWNGIQENEYDRFMEAHFASIDGVTSDDEEETERIKRDMERDYLPLTTD